MASDWIRLTNIVIHGSHGVTPAEQEIGRPFEVDVELGTDVSSAIDSDDLAATVDYAAVYEIVRRVHEQGPYHLLEAMAGRIAKEVMRQLAVEEVIVRVRKPHPPVGGIVGAAEVEVARQSSREP